MKRKKAPTIFSGTPWILLLAVSLCLPGCGGSSTFKQGSWFRPTLRPVYRTWPTEARGDILVSPFDDTPQRVKFYFPPESVEGKLPLLIYLHGWTQTHDTPEAKKCAAWCKQKGWAFISPGFRGSFTHPPGIGTIEVLNDILDAREFMMRSGRVGPVLLMGVSAGASTALVLVDRDRKAFHAVSVSVPIAHLGRWHRELEGTQWRYAKDMTRVFGGTPDQIENEYNMRSLLPNIRKPFSIPLDLNVGIYDGKTGPVPPEHSVAVFNRLCRLQGFSEIEGPVVDLIAKRDVKGLLAHSGTPLRDYPKSHRALYRRQVANLRFTVFQGGHQILIEPSLRWLESRL